MIKYILIALGFILLSSCDLPKNCIKSHKESMCLCAGGTPIKTEYEVCDEVNKQKTSLVKAEDLNK